ncbi:hypothetical protein WJX84_006090 [Apatococcus fuscideae]|uniref:TMEM205-like domain-containing protein n=1 Tax=Apatococcus fuscideae TaxID=2026836 RepID=A0AAW1SWP1_9CHLO
MAVAGFAPSCASPPATLLRASPFSGRSVRLTSRNHQAHHPARHFRYSSSSTVLTRAAAAGASTGGTMPAKADLGPMLSPSAANKSWVRLAVISVVIASLARFSGALPSQGVSFVHLMCFATWFGTQFWVTFVAGIVTFKTLARQQFGKLQSKLFPLYFLIGAACNTIMMGSLAFGPAGLAKKQAFVLGGSLVTALLNWVFVEPKTTDLMFERYELENAESRTDADHARIKTLRKQFGMWHGISSTINLASFIFAIAHGWWLSGFLATIGRVVIV